MTTDMNKFKLRMLCRVMGAPLLIVYFATIITCLVVGMLLFGIPGLFRTYASLHWSIHALLPIASFLYIYTILAIFLLRWYRVALCATKSRYQLCTKCWYDMRANAEARECPECGEPYSRVQAHELWRNCMTKDVRNYRWSRRFMKRFIRRSRSHMHAYASDQSGSLTTTSVKE